MNQNTNTKAKSTKTRNQAIILGGLLLVIIIMAIRTFIPDLFAVSASPSAPPVSLTSNQTVEQTPEGRVVTTTTEAPAPPRVPVPSHNRAMAIYNMTENVAKQQQEHAKTAAANLLNRHEYRGRLELLELQNREAALRKQIMENTPSKGDTPTSLLSGGAHNLDQNSLNALLHGDISGAALLENPELLAGLQQTREPIIELRAIVGPRMNFVVDGRSHNNQHVNMVLAGRYEIRSLHDPRPNCVELVDLAVEPIRELPPICLG
ncbi:hypothetical protein [Aliagarivorans taiwanensis]|uniref:hypothetical protein n=1 Tax=Aliagarivorans taiwanensis TaxID=561966 RepID=UPI0003F50947|nr:hypothetical protein [Aliagarivorans taiwanensis]